LLAIGTYADETTDRTPTPSITMANFENTATTDARSNLRARGFGSALIV
jgi:hypothetical protein